MASTFDLNRFVFTKDENNLVLSRSQQVIFSKDKSDFVIESIEIKSNDPSEIVIVASLIGENELVEVPVFLHKFRPKMTLHNDIYSVYIDKKFNFGNSYPNFRVIAPVGDDFELKLFYFFERNTDVD